MKIIFSIILFLNFTGSYRLIADLVGVKVSTVSLVILSGMAIFSIVHFRYAARLLKKGCFLTSFLLIFVWPVTTVLYAPEISFSRIALQIYYFFLFLGTVIYISQFGPALLKKLFALSYWTAVAGLVSSFLWPMFFSSVAELVNATSDYGGRAYGFMLQPNMAVTNLSILFILYLSGFNNKKYYSAAIAFLSYFLCMILTGSRSAVVVFIIVLLIYLFNLFVREARVRNAKIYIKKRLLVKLVTIAVTVVFIFPASVILLRGDSYSIIKTKKEGFYLKERLDNYLQGRLSDASILEDVNVRARLEFQKVFIAKIFEQPVLGYGLGSKDRMIYTGELSWSSHNQLLRNSLEHGVLYSLLLSWWFFIMPIFSRMRVFVESFFYTNWILQLVLVLLALCFVSNTVLDCRAVWAALGIVFFYLFILKRTDLSNNGGVILPCKVQ
jgi:hypothetical protein